MPNGPFVENRCWLSQEDTLGRVHNGFLSVAEVRMLEMGSGSLIVVRRAAKKGLSERLEKLIEVYKELLDYEGDWRSL